MLQLLLSSDSLSSLPSFLHYAKKAPYFLLKLIAITQQTTSTRLCLPIILFTDDVTMIISDRAAQSLCPGVNVPNFKLFYNLKHKLNFSVDVPSNFSLWCFIVIFVVPWSIVYISGKGKTIYFQVLVIHLWGVNVLIFGNIDQYMYLLVRCGTVQYKHVCIPWMLELAPPFKQASPFELALRPL